MRRCEKCGTVDIQVLQVRQHVGGVSTYRQYRCGNGHTFSTLEVSGVVSRSIGGRLDAAIKSAERGLAARRLAITRASQAKMLIVSMGAAQVAEKIGVTPSRVRQYLKSKQPNSGKGEHNDEG